jgi:acyl-CoA thioester hydrolase
MSSYRHRPTIRFFEADQQQVVYHMWYLAYFEDARNEMLAEGGMSLRFIQESGLDLQVVHYDLDWALPVRWGDDLVIDVDTAEVGTSSFRLTYEASVEGRRAVAGEAVYVVVGGAGQGAVPIPDRLRRVLSPGRAA